MFDRIAVDQKFISQLQTKATSIENNQTFIPLYSLKELIKKDELSRMEKLFNSINKLDVKLHKEQIIPINKVNIFDARNRKIEESNEVELDDDFLISPQKPQISKSSSLPIKNIPQNPPLSNRRSSNPQILNEVIDDEIIELEEIDVTDTLPPFLAENDVAFQQEMQRSGPLTIQESLKEPIPLVEVSKNCKPAPKNFFLSPLSPRTQLRRNSQNSNDSSSTIRYMLASGSSDFSVVFTEITKEDAESEQIFKTVSINQFAQLARCHLLYATNKIRLTRFLYPVLFLH